MSAEALKWLHDNLGGAREPIPTYLRAVSIELARLTGEFTTCAENYASQRIRADKAEGELEAARAALAHDCPYYDGMEQDVVALMKVPEFRLRHQTEAKALAWMEPHKAHRRLLAAANAVKATEGERG